MTDHRAALAIGLALVLATGCTMARHRQQVREGLLTKGLHRTAFLEEWGLPARTFPLQGREPVLRTNAFGGYWEKPIYDVWEYQNRATCLVFDGVRLIAWETGKTDCDPRQAGSDAEPAPLP